MGKDIVWSRYMGSDRIWEVSEFVKSEKVSVGSKCVGVGRECGE